MRENNKKCQNHTSSFCIKVFYVPLLGQALNNKINSKCFNAVYCRQTYPESKLFLVRSKLQGMYEKKLEKLSRW